MGTVDNQLGFSSFSDMPSPPSGYYSSQIDQQYTTCISKCFISAREGIDETCAAKCNAEAAARKKRQAILNSLKKNVKNGSYQDDEIQKFNIQKELREYQNKKTDLLKQKGVLNQTNTSEVELPINNDNFYTLSNNSKYVLIGTAILAAGVIGYLIFRKKS